MVNKPKIVIVGSAIDQTIDHFCTTAAWFGGEVVFLDLAFLALEIGTGRVSELLVLNKISSGVDSAIGVFMRDRRPQLSNSNETIYEILRGMALKSIRKKKGLPVINPLRISSTNFSKFQHLQCLAPIAETFGIKVPKTVLSNSIGEMIDFFGCDKPLIIKGASSKKTLAVKYSPKLLSQMVCAEPVIAQQWIDGDDVRVHVIGDRCVAERIRSESDDYRISRQNQHEQIDIPTFIRDFCIAVSRAEGLLLSGVDFLISEGTFYFLEVNSEPDFRGYDKRSNFAISRSIVEYLLNHNKK